MNLYFTDRIGSARSRVVLTLASAALFAAVRSRVNSAHLGRVRPAIVALILLTASAGGAQTSSALFVRNTSFRADSSAARDTSRSSGTKKFATRAGAGALGGAAGMVLGFFTGLAIAGPCNGCGDDLHGLGEAVVGGAVGAVIGTGTAAGIPRLGGGCSYGKRAGVGLAGSLVGGAVAIGILFLPQPFNWTAALGPPLGAALALKSC